MPRNTGSFPLKLILKSIIKSCPSMTDPALPG